MPPQIQSGSDFLNNLLKQKRNEFGFLQSPSSLQGPEGALGGSTGQEVFSTPTDVAPELPALIDVPPGPLGLQFGDINSGFDVVAQWTDANGDTVQQLRNGTIETTVGPNNSNFLGGGNNPPGQPPGQPPGPENQKQVTTGEQIVNDIVHDPLNIVNTVRNKLPFAPGYKNPSSKTNNAGFLTAPGKGIPNLYA